ncbi:hypothetical protein ASPFODRAFT_47445 [Aspergillus luchuensis CBS 106.47]|uniref:Uncharacterized protein n=1 Tax=Aspergillus luchuensis (strain CBS 106.47) TaxID=1137211 RepID=A0A1M3TDS2_ASPLC|nr:hypothetical protein ASPFODRAFT_47445 [Aspergillus luchuensis CBS 106.47]
MKLLTSLSSSPTTLLDGGWGLLSISHSCSDRQTPHHFMYIRYIICISIATLCILSLVP